MEKLSDGILGILSGFASNRQLTAHFWYDARNRVVARSYQAAEAEQPTLTLNTYDDWNLIEERDESGAQKARYVHGPRIDEIVVMKNDHGVFYPQHDALGSVTMLTDKDGKLAERYSYSVTGEVTIYDANGAEMLESALGNRWMYTGREWLPEIGLYDYRNRVYSAELERFLQADPTSFIAADLNLYRYVQNDFINYIDPDGMRPKRPILRDPEWLWYSVAKPKKYQLGRCGTWISPVDVIPNFIEDWFPAAHSFAVKHDGFVDYMEKFKFIPDIAYNIPSMVPTFVVAVFHEAVNTVYSIVSWVWSRITGE